MLNGLFSESFINSFIFHPPTTEPQLFKELTKKTDTYSSFVISIKPDDRFEITYLDILPIAMSSNKVIVFSHGTGADIYTIYDYLVNLAVKLKCEVVCYDYPGYGLSVDNVKKAPSEYGCYMAHELVINHITKNGDVKFEDLVLVGRSLGTGIVVDYVSKQKSWKNPILLVSPYKSMLKIAFDGIIGGDEPLDKFTTVNKITNITCPIKIYHGIDDELIPVHHGQHLYDILNDKSLEPVWVENATHESILNHVEYDDVI